MHTKARMTPNCIFYWETQWDQIMVHVLRNQHYYLLLHKCVFHSNHKLVCFLQPQKKLSVIPPRMQFYSKTSFWSGQQTSRCTKLCYRPITHHEHMNMTIVGSDHHVQNGNHHGLVDFVIRELYLFKGTHSCIPRTSLRVFLI